MNRAERELSEDEWQRLANKTACNEINRFYSAKMHREVPLSEINEINKINENIDSKRLTEKPAKFEIEGNTQAELHSILMQMWKSILSHSLREKYSLLLKNRELLNRLFAYKCCNIKEAADALELTKEEFIKIYRRLPLSDMDIAVLLQGRIREPISSENVLKARQRAKTKIRKDLAHLNLHGKTSVAGKT